MLSNVGNWPIPGIYIRENSFWAKAWEGGRRPWEVEIRNLGRLMVSLTEYSMFCSSAKVVGIVRSRELLGIFPISSRGNTATPRTNTVC